MILKHRDTEVLRFDWVKPFGVKDVELNKSAERFLPLAFRDRVLGKDERTLAYEFEEWLLHRTAPMRRECTRLQCGASASRTCFAISDLLPMSPTGAGT